MVVWVAYSGGVDSHVLLHALVSLRQQYSFILRAVHIHHGLNPKASDWQRHCESICRELEVELTVHCLHMSPSLENVEARARELRYQYFSSLLHSNDCLLTGHHQDDQAETLLLQLFRGAGPRGMSAMPARSSLGKGLLLRPFLDTTRDELVAYARTQQLVWVDDDSNQDVRFSRNFIRHQVMPLLQQRWPKISETLARSARHCAETEELLEDYVQPLFQNCVRPVDAGSKPVLSKISLQISRLKKLTFAQQKQVIRYWLLQQKFSLPSEDKLANLLHVFLKAQEDRNPLVTWGQVVIRRYQDALIASQVVTEHDARQIFSWDMSADLVIESLGLTLQVERAIGVGIKIFPGQKAEIRFRCGDEHVYLARRQGGRSLKKCFQEWRVPVWERNRIPLLYIDNALAAIVGYGVCEGFLVDANENGVVIDVKKRTGLEPAPTTSIPMQKTT